MAKSSSGMGPLVECHVCKLRVPLNWMLVCQACMRVYTEVLALRLHLGANTTEPPEKWVLGDG